VEEQAIVQQLRNETIRSQPNNGQAIPVAPGAANLGAIQQGAPAGALLPQ
jgi:hypothetical protein